MNLGTINNAFEFSLPADFVPQELEDKYMPMLKSYRKVYSTVLDYINSTIHDIDFPSITFPTVTQTMKRGKQTYWKGDQNIYDLFDRKGTITFHSVDGNLNHIIILHCLTHAYLNVNKTYDSPLVITSVDQNRKAMFHTQYKSLIFTNLDGTKYGYNDQTIQTKTFTMSFVYNYMDIEWTDDKRDNITGDSRTISPLQ